MIPPRLGVSAVNKTDTGSTKQENPSMTLHALKRFIMSFAAEIH
jgi:hypothetical protein